MTTLSNNEIDTEIAANRLVLNADRRMIEGGSYQLRLGNVYYDLTESARRFELKNGEKVLIKPGHHVVMITAEELQVPANLVVRVVSKGSLFSIGLSHVATYADPGFEGQLGIVTVNFSNKYIEISQGEPIAKAEFTRLASPATKLYRGQHGFQAGIWPIKTQLQKTYHDVKEDPRVQSEKQEAFALLPAATQVVIRRIEKTQLWTAFSLAIAILLNALTLFFYQHKLIDNLDGIIGNLVASAIVGIGVLLSLLRSNK